MSAIQEGAAGRRCFGTCTNEQKLIDRNVVRQDLWVKHLQSPVIALTAALRSVEEWEEAGSSTAGGSRT